MTLESDHIFHVRIQEAIDVFLLLGDCAARLLRQLGGQCHGGVNKLLRCSDSIGQSQGKGFLSGDGITGDGIAHHAGSTQHLAEEIQCAGVTGDGDVGKGGDQFCLGAHHAEIAGQRQTAAGTGGGACVRGKTGALSGGNGKCVFKNDDYPWLEEKMLEADGIILGSPIFEKGLPGIVECLSNRGGPSHNLARLESSLRIREERNGVYSYRKKEGQHSIVF